MASLPTLPCYVNTIADPVLLKIFSYLPLTERLHLSEVCRRWREVTHLDWLDIIDLDLAPIPSQNIGAVLRLSPNVESIFARRRFLILNDLMEHFQTELRSVKLYDATIGLARVTGDVKHTNEYRNILWLAQGSLRRPLSEEEHGRLAYYVHDDRSADHARAVELFTTALNRYFEKLPQLEELVLHNMHVTDLEQVPITTMIPFTINTSALNNSLTRLQLSGPRLRHCYFPHLLSQSLHKLQQLECLILHVILIVEEETIAAAEREFCKALESLHNLRELSLGVIFSVLVNGSPWGADGRVLSATAACNLPKLEVLFLIDQEVSRATLVNLFTTHPTLRVLMFGGRCRVQSNDLVPVRTASSPVVLHVFIDQHSLQHLPSPESTATRRIYPFDVKMKEFLERVDIAEILDGVWVAEMIIEMASFDPHWWELA